MSIPENFGKDGLPVGSKADNFMLEALVEKLSVRLYDYENSWREMETQLAATQAKLDKAIAALERQKKCWHNPDIGCLAECSITCEALAEISAKGDGE